MTTWIWFTIRYCLVVLENVLFSATNAGNKEHGSMAFNHRSIDDNYTISLTLQPEYNSIEEKINQPVGFGFLAISQSVPCALIGLSRVHLTQGGGVTTTMATVMNKVDAAIEAVLNHKILLYKKVQIKSDKTLRVCFYLAFLPCATPLLKSWQSVSMLAWQLKTISGVCIGLW